MNNSAIQKLRDCKSIEELSRIWEANVSKWSKLPAEEAKALIKFKNELKSKLQLFEEWSYWYEERAGIMEFDGGLNKREAEKEAKERLSLEVVISAG